MIVNCVLDSLYCANCTELPVNCGWFTSFLFYPFSETWVSMHSFIFCPGVILGVAVWCISLRLLQGQADQDYGSVKSIREPRDGSTGLENSLGQVRTSLSSTPTTTRTTTPV